MEFRNLPSVHDLLESPSFSDLLQRYPHALVRNAIRDLLDGARQKIKTLEIKDVTPDAIARQVKESIQTQFKLSLQPVINATGTVLHTNLGRAPLPEQAIHAVERICRGYCNLEFDLQSGMRGQRADHVSQIIARITGAEAAYAVNNNAGAVLLCLSALAAGRNVIISRGELIEIGGGFRIPDVMAASGALLRDVGTTNRTHLRDYENALDENTGLIFKAHRSNFDIVGFTHEVTISSLADLGKTHNIPVMYDLGSGCMFDGNGYGWQETPVTDALTDGADIVTFSGDKLLGGPQAGIIIGSKQFIDRISHHPLARALRLDKMTLTALEATLQLYLTPETVRETVPTIGMLTVDPADLHSRAEQLVHDLAALSWEDVHIRMIEENSAIGGGALPMVTLKTWVVAIRHKTLSAEYIREKLRHAAPPLICRIRKDEILLDTRTIHKSEFQLVTEVLKQIF